MAGSFWHVTEKTTRKFQAKLLDDLGDAYEALEEMHAMIHILAKGDRNKIKAANDLYYQWCRKEADIPEWPGVAGD